MAQGLWKQIECGRAFSKGYMSDCKADEFFMYICGKKHFLRGRKCSQSMSHLYSPKIFTATFAFFFCTSYARSRWPQQCNLMKVGEAFNFGGL